MVQQLLISLLGEEKVARGQGLGLGDIESQDYFEGLSVCMHLFNSSAFIWLSTPENDE